MSSWKLYHLYEWIIFCCLPWTKYRFPVTHINICFRLQKYVIQVQIHLSLIKITMTHTMFIYILTIKTLWLGNSTSSNTLCAKIWKTKAKIDKQFSKCQLPVIYNSLKSKFWKYAHHKNIMWPYNLKNPNILAWSE